MEWKSNVFSLTNRDFDSDGNLVNKNINKGNCILLVYANWCPHCVTLHPIYQQMANHVFGIIKVAALEDKNAKNFKGAVDFRGYPSIFLYKNGKLANSYEGNRDLPSLIEFAKDASTD